MSVWTATIWPTEARAALVAALQQWWDDGGEPGEDDEDGEWVTLPGRVLDSLAPFMVAREAAAHHAGRAELEWWRAKAVGMEYEVARLRTEVSR